MEIQGLDEVPIGRTSPVWRTTPWLAAILVSAVAGASLWFNLEQVATTTLETARTQGRAAFDKDVLYRRWNASIGGVYAPVGPDTPPNPYLDVERRDIHLPHGEMLTLVNPAYMTRQVHEIGLMEWGLVGHITSLQPIRPLNAADDWETEALRAFEVGETEWSVLAPIEDEEYMRLMRPLYTEQACLNCHAAQGYEEGDVRGGISVGVPMAPLRALEAETRRVLLFWHGVLWLLGLGGIGLWNRSVNGKIAEMASWEGAIREHAERFEQMFASHHAPMVLVSPKARVLVDANVAAVNFFGFPIDQLRGMAITELTQLREEEIVAILSRAMDRTQNRFVAPPRIASGEDRMVEIYASPILVRGEQLVFAIVHDVTDRIQAEEKLRQREQHLRSIYNGADSVAFITTDLAGTDARIVDFSPGAEKMFGFTAEEVRGVQASMLRPQETLVDLEAAHAALRDGAEARGGETTLVRKSGETFPAIYTIHPLTSAAGELVGALEVAVDIGDRKRAEEDKVLLERQLIQSQKMEAVGQLAGGMTHDFNNMLTSILANAQMALMDVGPGRAGHAELMDVVGAAERSRDLTGKLLTFARTERLDVRTQRIGKVVEDLEGLLGRTLSKKTRIRIDLQDDCLVNADTTLLQQAILNICMNADDAMPGGGELTIVCRGSNASESASLGDGECLADRHCVVEISDMGVGMSDETALKVVDPFFTTKGQGSGLGLSVSHGIVRSHGGYLHISSVVDTGTCVAIHLPLSDGVEEGPVVGVAPVIPGGDETILVVDDEPSLLRSARRVLEKRGYSTILTDRGARAVEIYRERGDTIDLVLLDMVMPEMDGGEVYRALREIDSDVKVVLSSGYSSGGRAGELMREGIHAFVQKPYTVDTLCAAVRRVLDLD